MGSGRSPWRQKLAQSRPKLDHDAAMKQARGFTLIEVLVAVAIVAVTLAAGLRAAGSVTDNAQRLADVTAAQWCADNHLAELRLTKAFPGVGDTEFGCEQLGRRFKGTLRARPTLNPNFRRVDAVVGDEAGRPILTLSTVVRRG
jgi:general secretion pathway protein I